MWLPTVQKSYWIPQPTSDELYHHGILGQSWGHRNGPPYPLDAGDHSAKEKKAGYKKSLNKGSEVKSTKNKVQTNPVEKVSNSGTKSTNQQFDETQEAYNALRKYNQYADSWNKERDKKFSLNKEQKLKDLDNKKSEQLNEIDKYFDNNPMLQKKLIDSATDIESMYGSGAYRYLDRKILNTFGDWYWEEYKSDRAKKAFTDYQKEMAKADKIREQKKAMAKEEFDGKTWRAKEEKYTKMESEILKIQRNANSILVKAAMEDIGLDKSLQNDPAIQKKMRDIVIWD